jgi:dolichol-phosphate mannosyltransferase
MRFGNRQGFGGKARRLWMATLRYDLAHRPQAGGERRLLSEGADLASEAGRGLDEADCSAISLSVVVPARDEARSLPRLVEEIVGALRPVFGAAGFEILVVDDGSVDGTRLVLAELARITPELRGIVMAGNVGQSAAIVAGMRQARGEWIGTLDADLQNAPADLLRLWEVLPGHDVVLGWRVDRKDHWWKRVVSRSANWVRNAVLGQSIQDTGCSVRIFRRSAALRLPVFCGVHRFFGPLLLREGCRMVQVPVGHRPRTHGRSHYGVWNRSWRVVIDLIGVAWLMGRPVGYQIAETLENQNNGSASEPLAALPGATSPTSTLATRLIRRSGL